MHAKARIQQAKTADLSAAQSTGQLPQHRPGQHRPTHTTIITTVPALQIDSNSSHFHTLCEQPPSSPCLSSVSSCDHQQDGSAGNKRMEGSALKRVDCCLLEE